MGMVVSSSIVWDALLNATLLRDVMRVVPSIPQWPRYSSKPTNFVFRLSQNQSYVEADTYRASGMTFINSIAR